MIDTMFALRMPGAMLQYLRSSTLSEHFLDRTKAIKLAEALVHTQFPEHAIQVLLLAHKLGCPLKQNAYECVAHQLAEAKQWHLIPVLVRLGKRQTGRTTVRLLNWRTRAVIEAAHFALLERVLDEFELENLKPNRRTFHLLVYGHLRNHNLRLARECLKRMEAAGFPTDATTHATVVSVYRSLGVAQEIRDHAFRALPDMGDRASTVTLNSLMQLYFDANDVPGVLRVLSLFHQGDMDTTLVHDFGQSSIPPDGSGARHHSSAMPEASISIPPTPIMPDAATFTILINFMARQQDLPGALRMMERMVAVGVKPDSTAVATMLRVYLKTGREGAAMRIVADMCHKHNVPRSLLNSLGLASQDVHPLPFNVHNIPLDAEVFNVLMRGALNTRGLSGGRVVLRVMRYCNVKPDAWTVSTILSHLDQVLHFRPRDLMQVLRNLLSTTVRPTLNHIHIIMRSVLRRQKLLLQGSGWDVTAAKFSSSRQDLSLYPEGHISGIAGPFDPTAGIQFPRKLSFRALVRPIVRSLSSRRIMNDRITIALRLRHEAMSRSNLNTAKDVFREMLARGMHPNKYHFAALMEGHAQSGDLRGAENVMDSALEVGIQPNVFIFTILIVGHARRGNPDRAMRTFQGMIAAGIRPDVPAVDAIASAYFAVGAYKIAKRVLLVLWPHVQAPPKDMQGASLKHLARALRAQHANRNPGDHDPKRLTKSEKRALRWKIDHLLKAWKAIGRPLPKGRLHQTRNKTPRL